MRRGGFTLIELMVAMAIVALLLSVVAPRYLRSTDRAKEAVLQENLFALRDAIDKFYSDRGRYPARLDELAVERYLRRIPVDPMTEREDTWVTVAPSPPESGVADVRSGAVGNARDGSSFADW